MKRDISTLFVVLILVVTGIYPQFVTAQTSSCIGTASLDVVIEDCTSIEDVSFDQSYRLFPNPASQSITIETNHPLQQDAVVKLVNMLGQTLSRNNLSQRLTLDISAYPAGVYFVIVESHQNIATKQILIQ
ncbi:MAG: T9SS type A sorting domain-containing protein [Sphingobacteriales bacterium]|nr:MAG: T9SS type A sorting domain-containing protein [Sphingobacteriales bacterium]